MTPLPVLSVRAGADRARPGDARRQRHRRSARPARTQRAAAPSSSAGSGSPDPTGARSCIDRARARDAPRISVLIATYDRPELLRACLASFAEQTLDRSDYEVVVVDDGSDGDDLAAVLDEFAGPTAGRRAADRARRPQRGEEPRGAPRARADRAVLRRRRPRRARLPRAPSRRARGPARRGGRDPRPHRLGAGARAHAADALHHRRRPIDVRLRAPRRRAGARLARLLGGSHLVQARRCSCATACTTSASTTRSTSRWRGGSRRPACGSSTTRRRAASWPGRSTSRRSASAPRRRGARTRSSPRCTRAPRWPRGSSSTTPRSSGRSSGLNEPAPAPPRRRARSPQPRPTRRRSPSCTPPTGDVPPAARQGRRPSNRRGDHAMSGPPTTVHAVREHRSRPRPRRHAGRDGRRRRRSASDPGLESHAGARGHGAAHHRAGLGGRPRPDRGRRGRQRLAGRGPARRRGAPLPGEQGRGDGMEHGRAALDRAGSSSS